MKPDCDVCFFFDRRSDAEGPRIKLVTPAAVSRSLRSFLTFWLRADVLLKA